MGNRTVVLEKTEKVVSLTFTGDGKESGDAGVSDRKKILLPPNATVLH